MVQISRKQASLALCLQHPAEIDTMLELQLNAWREEGSNMVSYQGEVSLSLMTSQREDFYVTFFRSLQKCVKHGLFPSMQDYQFRINSSIHHYCTKYWWIELCRMCFFFVIYFIFFLSSRYFSFFSAFPSFNSNSTFFSHLISTGLPIKNKKRGEKTHTLHRLLRDGQSAWSVCLAPASPCQAARALRRCFDLSRAAAIVRMRLSVKREEKLESSRPAVSTGPE